MVELSPLVLHVSEPGPLQRLTLDRDRNPALVAELVTLLGLSFPSPHRPSGVDPMMIWQGPNDFLILGAIDTVALRQATNGSAALVGDAAYGLVAFELVGDALGQRLGHDRPSAGLCSRVMRFAGLRVTAIWFDRDTPAVRLLVDRSYADYLRHWLHDRWEISDPRR